MSTCKIMPILFNILFMFILISSIVMTGCQKSNDADNDSEIQVTKITPKQNQEDSPEKAIEVQDSETVKSPSTMSDSDNMDSKPTNATDTFEIIDGVIVNKATTDNGGDNTSDDDDNLANATNSLDSAQPEGSESVSTPFNQATSDSTDTDRPLSAKERQALSEKQITDVEYQSQTGQTIKVTFQTSALEALEADVMLPSGQRVILTAPEGQGNNPIYQSNDGSIQLVTHGGGGSIDLIYEGRQSSFNAISAEAEVVSTS